MTRHCSLEGCFVHDGEACALGKLDISSCERYLPSNDPDTEITEEIPIDAISRDVRVPWSGSSLGLSDMSIVAARRKPILIGLVGAHDAGKTTLLTGSYLQILRGASLANARFAGSYTLGGWEALAAWVRFDDAARTPTFPPHTPRGVGRVPGLLHLAIKHEQKGVRDLLFADAPGEWFTKWAVHKDALDAEGAKWVANNSDAFLIFADCERLSGPNRGEARNDLRLMIERLGNHVGQRPCILVWAKDDHTPPIGIQDAVRRALVENIPLAIEMASSTQTPASLQNVLTKIIEMSWNSPQSAEVIPPVLLHQPFEAFRGHHANT